MGNNGEMENKIEQKELINLKFGYIKSPEDSRDYNYRNIKTLHELPSKFFLDRMSIRDQLNLGSCVGFGGIAVKDRQERKNHPAMNYRFSPMFLYSECKKRDGIPSMEGTYPRVAMKVMQELGVCREQNMPYVVPVNPLELPTATTKAYEDAKSFKIGAYARVYTLQEIKQAVMEDSPVLVGLTLCENFITPENGFIDLPQGYLLGGHAMAVDGWDDDLTYTYKNGKTRKGFLRVINSWGESWGDGGYCYIPYDYFYFRSDMGMSFFDEAWTSVDVIMPNKNAEVVELWLNSTRAIVDGQEIQLEQPPVLEPSTERTLLPVRFLSEVFGYKVDWNATEKKITIRKG